MATDAIGTSFMLKCRSLVMLSNAGRELTLFAGLQAICCSRCSFISY
jgi:hypothetical protein